MIAGPAFSPTPHAAARVAASARGREGQGATTAELEAWM